MKHMQSCVDLASGQLTADTTHQLMLTVDDRRDRRPPCLGEPHQRGAPVRRVGDQLDEAGLLSVVDHPLHELPAEVLLASHLRHGERLFTAQQIKHGPDADRHAHRWARPLNDPGNLAIYGPEHHVYLGQPVREFVRRQRVGHDLSMTPTLSNRRPYDTLVVMLTLTLSDQRIAYDDSGVGPGTPLVLLHGGVVDRRMWGPQLTAFSGRRVVAPDARGHGGSSDAAAPYRLADDVVTLLDALEIERAVLAGVSMGGGTAVDVALVHPSRVAALVVSGTGTSEPEFHDPWTLGVMADWSAAEQRGDAEAWLDAFSRFTHGPHRTRPEVDAAVWDLVQSLAGSVLDDHVTVGPDGTPVPPIAPTPVADTWQRIGQITAPVLTLPGALDSDDHHSLARRLAAGVPNGHYQEIRGAAHYPNLENPQAFNQEVAEFLRLHDL